MSANRRDPAHRRGTGCRADVNRVWKRAWPGAVAALVLLPGLLAAPRSADAGEGDDDGWRFTLTPYLWGAALAASTVIDGTEPPDLGDDYSFFTLENLDAAAFASFEARKDEWALFTDVFYVSFSDNFEAGPLRTDFRLHGNAQEVSVLWYPRRFQRLALVGGARRISIGLDFELDPGPDPSITRDWIDPILGMRAAWPLTSRWQLLARGDVGGFGTASDLTVNAVLGAGFEASARWSVLFAYRYLRVDFKDARAVLDLVARGPGIGVQVRF